MVKYLLDTNIISELRKPRPNPHLIQWLHSIPSHSRHLSVMTLGEIRLGIEKQRLRDIAYSEKLEEWLAAIMEEYKNRLLSFDAKVADCWGRLPLGNPVHMLDLQIAATALTHHCIMVTRNVKHFAGIVPDIINPFEPPHA